MYNRESDLVESKQVLREIERQLYDMIIDYGLETISINKDLAFKFEVLQNKRDTLETYVINHPDRVV